MKAAERVGVLYETRTERCFNERVIQNIQSRLMLLIVPAALLPMRDV